MRAVGALTGTCTAPALRVPGVPQQQLPWGHGRRRGAPCVLHPPDSLFARRYQTWWHTTVLVAAITAFIQPYYISFAPPGL